jgi:hypothetical protein
MNNKRKKKKKGRGLSEIRLRPDPYTSAALTPCRQQFLGH